MTARDRFEAWMRKNNADSADVLWRDCQFPDCYHYGATEAAWQAWQAAEAEAPEHCPICTDDAAPFRKDAERYRWLRDNPWPPILEADIVLHRNARWDAAIDAAMAASVPAVGAA